jgi:alpha-L-glutamate ligase-like protein
MKWWTAFRRLRELGILGMNQRNASCILDLNPRAHFPLVDSKQRMHKLCGEIGVPTPELYGVVPVHSAMGKLPQLLEGHADFVVKPDRGAGGRGILVVTGREGDRFLRHNGERLTLADIRQQVSSIISGLYSLGGRSDEALLQQRILLHPAFEAISYQGIGDLRIILYKNVPVMAMLRLPTKASGGRANLHQGGIGAGVDVATGLTSRAVLRSRLTDRHPDTGNSVVGFQVPEWPRILSIAIKVSRAVQLGYLGVDIVLDKERGPLLLEANARPGLAIQIANGKGLLPQLEAVDRGELPQLPADPGEAVEINGVASEVAPATISRVPTP